MMPEKHPTWPEYRTLVRVKAKDIDSGKSLTTALNATLNIIGGLIALGAASTPVSNDKQMAIAGIGIGLLLIGGWNMWRCFTYAPWKLHCEQLDKMNAIATERDKEIEKVRSVERERDEARATLDERPLQMVDAASHLNKLGMWLRREAAIPRTDITLHVERATEVMLGLFKESLKWVPDGRNASSMTIEECKSVLQFMAANLSTREGNLAPSAYNERWKPPVWLTSIDGKRETIRRQSLIS